MKPGPCAVALVAALVAALPHRGSAARVQPLAESREVRHLVTFQFVPGQARTVLGLYTSQLVPRYRETPAMRHVRGFSEVESPEPLDLLVVTHYADMAAMDRASEELRQPVPSAPPVALLYTQIANLSLGHRDQFAELISPSNFAPAPEPSLEVLEFLRVDPSSAEAFERQMLSTVHPWEEEDATRGMVARSETLRFVVADGWDYLRTYTVKNLAGWQAYVTSRARHPAAAVAMRLASGRKTLILREMPTLRVR